jgi:hypothetical protein
VYHIQQQQQQQKSNKKISNFELEI